MFQVRKIDTNLCSCPESDGVVGRHDTKGSKAVSFVEVGTETSAEEDVEDEDAVDNNRDQNELTITVEISEISEV